MTVCISLTVAAPVLLCLVLLGTLKCLGCVGLQPKVMSCFSGSFLFFSYPFLSFSFPFLSFFPPPSFFFLRKDLSRFLRVLCMASPRPQCLCYVVKSLIKLAWSPEPMLILIRDSHIAITCRLCKELMKGTLWCAWHREKATRAGE